MPCPSPVKEVVRCTCAHVFLFHLADLVVIKFVPFTSYWVFAEGSVMTETHVSEMVGDCVTIVDQWLTLTNYVFAHVETIQREINIHINLLPSTTSSTKHSHPSVTGTLFACLEPLKTDHNNWWHFINLELLCSLHVLFALGAIPFVVLVKNFLFFKRFETVVD